MSVRDFSDLQPGDRVFISQAYGRVFRSGVVLRLTKTQIIVRNEFGREDRFRMDGYEVGSRPDRGRLLRHDDEHARMAVALEAVRSASWRLSAQLEDFRRNVESASLDDVLSAVRDLQSQHSSLTTLQKTQNLAEKS